MGEWYGEAERRIWQELEEAQGIVTKVKRLEVTATGRMTARQFNAIRFDLGGKQESRLANLKLRKEDLEDSIRRYKEKVKKEERKFGIPWKAKQARFKVHQFRQRIASQGHKLNEVMEDMARPHPKLCFGSRKLFHEQFNWNLHGYSSRGEWLDAWRDARSNHFFCLGSGNKTGGNQSCTLSLDSYDYAGQVLKGKLRLRLPKEFPDQDLTTEVAFTHQAHQIYHALATGQAISYLWVRKEKGWYVHADTREMPVPIVTDRKSGGLAIDFNPASMALGRISRDGNPLFWATLDYDLRGKGSEQCEAEVGALVKEIVLMAQRLESRSSSRCWTSGPGSASGRAGATTACCPASPTGSSTGCCGAPPHPWASR